jgi:hypothetical protein
LFGNFIQTYNNSLATATLEDAELSYVVSNKEHTLNQILRLANNMVIYTLSNFGDNGSLTITYNGEQYPKKAKMNLKKGINRYFIHNLDLSTYGINQIIDYALFEINKIIKDENTLYLITNYEGNTELSINDNIYVLDGTDKKITFGKMKLVIKCLSVHEAALIKTIHYGILVLNDDIVKSPTYDTNINHLLITEPLNYLDGEEVETENLSYLEDYNLYEGYGYYHFNNIKSNMIYLEEAGDIVSLYSDNSWQETQIGCMTPLLFETATLKEQLVFKVEIWGHTNFHDNRLKGLNLDAKRGIKGAYEIIDTIMYQDEFIVDCPMILTIHGDVNGTLTINSDKYGLNKYHNIFNLSKYIGESVVIDYHLKKGMIKTKELYKISEIKPYKITLTNEPCFTRQLLETKTKDPISIPLTIGNGESRIISFDIDNPKKKNKYLIIDAKKMKMTVLFNGKVINRLYMNENNLVKMTGGGKNRVYLPGKWFNGSTHDSIKIYLESLFEESILHKISVFDVNM